MGLSDYIKNQPLGINTALKPEGKFLSETISNKIVLARSIVRKPKVLILKEPLTRFSTEEKTRIIEFLFHKSNSWSIIISSQNPLWKEYCERVIWLENGTSSTSN